MPARPSLVKSPPQSQSSLLLASLCRRSFLEFIREFWEMVPGAGKLIENWHIRLFADELQTIAERVFRGEPKAYDFVLNVSPGTSKSTVWSVLFQPWAWTRMPEARVLSASHTDMLALDLANKSRQVIKSDKYHECFPEIILRDDQDTKGYFANTRGGDRLTCTVAGKSPVGFHAHLIIVDDPIDPKKVLSEVEVKTAREFMTNVIPTRKVDKAVSVTALVMQRLGVGDPTEVMLEEAKKEGAAKVRHVCLPSELERANDGGWDVSKVIPEGMAANYVDGLMDPRRLGRAVLAEYKARGAHFYSTQFLQKPYSISGGMFRESYFDKRVKAAPYTARRVCYWDRSFSGNENSCNTVGTVVSVDGDGNWYFGPVLAGRWEPGERDERMRGFAQRCRDRWGPSNDPQHVIEQEPAAGKDSFQYTARKLVGFPVFADPVHKKKELRAEPLAAQFAAGNCFIVDDGTWDVGEWVRELCSFPNGVRKDRVDSASGGFNWLLKNRTRGVGRFQILTYHAAGKKPRGLRFLWGTFADLADTKIDMPALLLAIRTPSPALVSVGGPAVGEEPGGLPPHGLNLLLESAALTFAGDDPAAYQDRWGQPLEGFGGMTAEEATMRPAQGKRFWAMIRRDRTQRPELMVVADDTDGTRALSVCYAAADMLLLKRPEVVGRLGDHEWMGKDDPAPCRHVYQQTRASRAMVV